MEEKPQDTGLSVVSLLTEIAHKINDTNISLSKLTDMYLGGNQSSNTSPLQDLNVISNASNLNSFRSKKKTLEQQLLFSINDNLTGLYNFLVNKKVKKPETKSTGSINESINEAHEGVKEMKSSLSTNALNELILTLNTKLNSKLFKQMDRFNSALDKMLSFDSKKVGKFNGAIIKLTESIEKLSESKFKEVSTSILIVTASLTVLGLLSMSPLLPAAIIMLGGFFWILNKFVGKEEKEIPKNMIEFATGMGILTLSMVVLEFLDWTSIFKMLVFIGGIGLVFSLSTKMMKTDLPKGLIEFAAGIGILTLAMVVLEFLDWTAIFKMLAFIGGIGLVFFLSSKLMGTDLPKGLINFAMGVGILTLSMIAMSFVSWGNVFKLIAFIAMLGAEIILINKFGGGTGPMKGLPGFAFGIGLLVLALYAIQDIPLIAMGKMLLFIAGLGLVMKLFSPKSGAMMLMIGVGIVAISLAFMVFKNSNFEISDALVFVGSVGLIAGVMLLLGIPAIAGLLITGSIALIGIGAASLLMSLSLATISALNIDFGKITQFILSMGALAAGFVLLTPVAALALISAVLFIPIAASALIAGASLALISLLTVNEKKISDFGSGLKSLANAYNDLSIWGLTKAVAKSVILIPLAVTSLMVAGLFKILENMDMNKASTNMTTMIDTLTQVMTKLETWKNKNSKESINSIRSFVESFRSLNTDVFKSFTDSMTTFLNAFSDDKKWASIEKNMETMKKNIKEIVSNINMINLNKAIILEKNLRALTTQSSTDNLRIVIQQLKEMIGLLNDSKEIQSQSYNYQQQYSPIVNNTPLALPGTTNNKENSNKTTEDLLDNLSTIMNQVLNKLGTTLTVAVVDGNSNKFSKF
jgi:hypothetical protein